MRQNIWHLTMEEQKINTPTETPEPIDLEMYLVIAVVGGKDFDCFGLLG